MKMFIAALAHETNSFSPVPTSLQNYKGGVFYRPGEDDSIAPETVFVGYGDFCRIARARGHEPVLSRVAWAQPSAPTVRQDYEKIRDEILDDLKAALPVDGVLLLLHGAQMAQGYEDCEGDLLSRIRAIVGPDTPIGAELDLHCNITDLMMKSATAIIACKEYPHTDFPERAEELYDIIENTAKNAVAPVMAICRAPMLCKFHTTREPMRGFVDKTTALEGRDGILSVTLAHGFAWSDIQSAGSSVLVIADGDEKKAQGLADKLAREMFSMRHDVRSRFVPLEAALDDAFSCSAAPIVMADASDNAGGGAPGDATFVLRALLDRNAKDTALGMIWDPVAVQTAFAAGEGAEIDIRIGGKMGPMSGQPLDVNARILALHENPTQRGLEPQRPEIMGPSAALRIDGVDVIINSNRQQVFSPDCFTALGVDLRAKKLIVVKSSQHFYTLFESLAEKVVYCDAPGALNGNLAQNPYKNIRRPIWPLDEVEWPDNALPRIVHA